jgi:hypothetical protein
MQLASRAVERTRFFNVVPAALDMALILAKFTDTETSIVGLARLMSYGLHSRGELAADADAEPTPFLFQPKAFSKILDRSYDHVRKTFAILVTRHVFLPHDELDDYYTISTSPETWADPFTGERLVSDAALEIIKQECLEPGSRIEHLVRLRHCPITGEFSPKQRRNFTGEDSPLPTSTGAESPINRRRISDRPAQNLRSTGAESPIDRPPHTPLINQEIKSVCFSAHTPAHPCEATEQEPRHANVKDIVSETHRIARDVATRFGDDFDNNPDGYLGTISIWLQGGYSEGLIIEATSRAKSKCVSAEPFSRLRYADTVCRGLFVQRSRDDAAMKLALAQPIEPQPAGNARPTATPRLTFAEEASQRQDEAFKIAMAMRQAKINQEREAAHVVSA